MLNIRPVFLRNFASSTHLVPFFKWQHCATVATKAGRFLDAPALSSLSEMLQELKPLRQDSFLRHTHTYTKGKNESMERGETWSNCSLPLSSWFPDITVVSLTFRGLTAGSTALHAIVKYIFYTHSWTVMNCHHYRVQSELLDQKGWYKSRNDSGFVPLFPGPFRRGWGGSLAAWALHISGSSAGGRGLDRMHLPTSRFGLKQMWGSLWLPSVMRTQEHTHTLAHTQITYTKIIADSGIFSRSDTVLCFCGFTVWWTNFVLALKKLIFRYGCFLRE